MRETRVPVEASPPLPECTPPVVWPGQPHTRAPACPVPAEPRSLTLAVASVGGQPVPRRRAAALEAPGEVDAAVGADVAASGQGALVDVCNSKAHPQRRGAQAGPRVPGGARPGPGRAAAQGQLDTGALQVRGLGWRRRASHQKGKQAQRGEGTSLGPHSKLVWGRRRDGGRADGTGRAPEGPGSGALAPGRSLRLAGALVLITMDVPGKTLPERPQARRRLKPSPCQALQEALLTRHRGSSSDSLESVGCTPCWGGGPKPVRGPQKSGVWVAPSPLLTPGGPGTHGDHHRYVFISDRHGEWLSFFPNLTLRAGQGHPVTSARGTACGPPSGRCTDGAGGSLTLAGDPVRVAELEAAAAVALEGAVDVGALLAAGAAGAFVHV